MSFNREIRIDNMLPFISCPHYCRDDSDKVRWLALKFGFVKAINPKDTVTPVPEMGGFILRVEEEEV